MRVMLYHVAWRCTSRASGLETEGTSRIFNSIRWGLLWAERGLTFRLEGPCVATDARPLKWREWPECRYSLLAYALSTVAQMPRAAMSRTSGTDCGLPVAERLARDGLARDSPIRVTLYHVA